MRPADSGSITRSSRISRMTPERVLYGRGMGFDAWSLVVAAKIHNG